MIKMENGLMRLTIMRCGLMLGSRAGIIINFNQCKVTRIVIVSHKVEPMNARFFNTVFTIVQSSIYEGIFGTRFHLYVYDDCDERPRRRR